MSSPIWHFVGFAFTPDASEEAKNKIITGAQALEHSCKKPDGSSYIKTFTVGSGNVSPEGMHGPASAYLLAQFASVEDRDYYLYKDPAHVEYAVRSELRTHLDSPIGERECALTIIDLHRLRRRGAVF